MGIFGFPGARIWGNRRGGFKNHALFPFWGTDSGQGHNNSAGQPAALGAKSGQVMMLKNWKKQRSNQCCSPFFTAGSKKKNGETGSEKGAVSRRRFLTDSSAGAFLEAGPGPEAAPNPLAWGLGFLNFSKF